MPSRVARPSVMDDDRERLLGDLAAIAASIQDPARRREVERIIARLSPRDGAWPDEAELMRLRLKHTGGAN